MSIPSKPRYDFDQLANGITNFDRPELLKGISRFNRASLLVSTPIAKARADAAKAAAEAQAAAKDQVPLSGGSGSLLPLAGVTARRVVEFVPSPFTSGTLFDLIYTKYQATHAGKPSSCKRMIKIMQAVNEVADQVGTTVPLTELLIQAFERPENKGYGFTRELVVAAEKEHAEKQKKSAEAAAASAAATPQAVKQDPIAAVAGVASAALNASAAANGAAAQFPQLSAPGAFQAELQTKLQKAAGYNTIGAAGAVPVVGARGAAGKCDDADEYVSLDDIGDDDSFPLDAYLAPSPSAAAPAAYSGAAAAPGAAPTPVGAAGGGPQQPTNYPKSPFRSGGFRHNIYTFYAKEACKQGVKDPAHFNTVIGLIEETYDSTKNFLDEQMLIAKFGGKFGHDSSLHRKFTQATIEALAVLNAENEARAAAEAKMLADANAAQEARWRKLQEGKPPLMQGAIGQTALMIYQWFEIPEPLKKDVANLDAVFQYLEYDLRQAESVKGFDKEKFIKEFTTQMERYVPLYTDACIAAMKNVIALCRL
jgi:hypothetical protein